MNKCQHGERFTEFCIYQQCTHRDQSGCIKCMQLFHNHGLNTNFTNEQQIAIALQKFVFDKNVKPFSESLIHKIYTLLTFYKNCMSRAIDNFSTSIVNKLGHTFMFGKPHFQTYSKLRKKQFGKINQKQLIAFLDFTKTLNPEWVKQIQQTRYKEFSEEVVKLMQELNKSFYQISSILPFKQSDIKTYQKNYKQLQQINIAMKNSIEDKSKCINPLKKLNMERPDRIQRPPQLIKMTDNFNFEQTKSRGFIRTLTDKEKTLELSIDKKLPFRIQRPNSLQKNLKQNETRGDVNEITDSFEFKNNLRNLVSRKIQNKKMSFSEQLQRNPSIQNKILPQKNRKYGNNQETKLQEQYASIQLQKKYWKLSEEINKQQFPLELILGTILKHTILPDPIDNTTPYENTQNIKNKTIKVPIGINKKQIEEVSSPIFQKYKNRKKKGGLFVINKILQKEQPIKQNQDANDYEFSENQTNSLAILLKALTEPSVPKAIQMIQQSYKLAPNNISAAQYLSYLYILQNRPKQCLKICNEVLEKIANSPNYDQNYNIRSNKAAALNMLGRFSEAIAILQNCLNENKKHIFYKITGDAYYGIGIYEKAITNYEQALKLNKANHQTQFNLAVCYYIQGNYNISRNYLNEALELSNDKQQYQQLKIQLQKLQ